MKLQTIVEIVEGNLVVNHEGDTEFEYGLTSDLMSDVLRLEFENGILITGLNNIQTIRTAEMSDIHCVIIGRDKKITKDMIALAQKLNIALVETKHTIFRVSGLLFKHGIKAVY